MAYERFILTNTEPNLNANSEEMAAVLIERLGLMPRKKGSTEKMHNVLIQIYEKAKEAGRSKKPSLAVLTVEEMAVHAGITRQTMYEYLNRWLLLDFITKASYIDQYNKVIVGYRLNGPTLEAAIDKSKARINNNIDVTKKIIIELQKVIKNEKISKKSKKTDENEA